MAAPTDPVTVKTVAAVQSVAIVALIEVVGPVAGELMMSAAGAFIGGVIALILFEAPLALLALFWHLAVSTVVGMFGALIVAPYAAGLLGLSYTTSTLAFAALALGLFWKRAALLAQEWVDKARPKP